VSTLLHDRVHRNNLCDDAESVYPAYAVSEHDDDGENSQQNQSDQPGPHAREHVGAAAGGGAWIPMWR
jgi:hypothetical protein